MVFSASVLSKKSRQITPKLLCCFSALLLVALLYFDGKNGYRLSFKHIGNCSQMNGIWKIWLIVEIFVHSYGKAAYALFKGDRLFRSCNKMIKIKFPCAISYLDALMKPEASWKRSNMKSRLLRFVFTSIHSAH